MPSVFKLSLSTKRTRPCTLDGKPSIISTDAWDGCARGALRKRLWCANKSSKRARRDDGGRTQIYQRLAITHSAFKITIGGADRDLALFFPTPTPPQPSPRPRPRQAPQPDGSGIAPASSKVFQSPFDSDFACTSALAAAR